jgi:hypothetical protein
MPGAPHLAEQGVQCRFRIPEALPAVGTAKAGVPYEFTLGIGGSAKVSEGQLSWMNREAALVADIVMMEPGRDRDDAYARLTKRVVGALDIAVDRGCRRMRWQGSYFDVVMDTPERLVGEGKHPQNGAKNRLSLQREPGRFVVRLENTLGMCDPGHYFEYVYAWKPQPWKPARGRQALEAFNRGLAWFKSTPPGPPGPPLVCPH